MAKVKRVGILTGGGDCPGLNAVLRAVVKVGVARHGMEFLGFEDGFSGLVEGRFRPLSFDDVSGILAQGGTILGTSNRADPFRYPVGDERVEDRSSVAVQNYKELALDALVCLGGDGTLKIALGLSRKGIRVVGVPKTIDNDLACTDFTFGHLTAVANATEAIDKIHTTAESHHRVMIVETMGRYAGWLALRAGIAGGGDMIVIPEIPYRVDVLCEKAKERNRFGRRFSIVVVAEGAKPLGGSYTVSRRVEGSPDPIRLGGVGHVLARQIELCSRIESRVTVLGHLQRGGSPVAFDRILATRFGAEACGLLSRGEFGLMVGLHGSAIRPVPIEKAVRRLKRVPRNHEIVRVARSLGTCFGD